METIHVLLVSDDPIEVDQVQDLLHSDPGSMTHYHVDACADYNETLKALVRNTHDVFLLNQIVPGAPLSGIELAKRANAGGCQSPIILLTTMPDEDMEMVLEDCGAAAFLNRGLDMQERTVKHVIRYAISNFKQLQEIKEQLVQVQQQLIDVGRKLSRRP
jgi:DNA-binding response OmpR family regulator